MQLFVLCGSEIIFYILAQTIQAKKVCLRGVLQFTLKYINMIKLNFILAFFCLILLAACTDNSTFGSSGKNRLANEYLNDIAQFATFDASDSLFTFVSAQDVTVSLEPQCLLLAGQPISGKVDFKYIEIFDKGTMAITDKHTTGINYEGNLNMLESGGEFFLELTNEDRKLDLDQYCRYTITYESKTDLAYGMDLFKGLISDDNILWNPVYGDGSLVSKEEESNQYSILVDFFDWINCDRFLIYDGENTSVNFTIPSSKVENARVYLSFDGLNTGLSTTFGEFPLGLDCHYIVLHEKGDKIEYVIDGFTMTQDLTIEISNSDFKTASIEEVIELVNELP